MPSSVIDRDRVSGSAQRTGIAVALATLGGALLLIVALIAALAFVVDVLGRLGGSRPFDPDLLDRAALFLGLGCVLASLLALPAALGASFVRTGDPPLRSHSALALVPGCVAALAVLVVSVVAVMALSGAGIEAGATLFYRRMVATFGEILFLTVPISLALAAVLGGARTPEATAAVAAPVMLAWLTGLLGGLSIAGLLLGLLLPLLGLAVVMAILYAMAPARAVTPWLTGIALAGGLILLTATALMTPTEAIALIALFGLPIAFLVRVLALRQSAGAMLRQAATETVSIVLVVAASSMAAVAFTLAKTGIGEGLATSAATLVGGGVALFVLAYMLTPALVLGLALPLVLGGLGGDRLDQAHIAVVAIVLGLAAMLARGARRDSAHSLPPSAAWTAAAALIALAILVALAPGIALAPMRTLLN